MKRKEVFEKSMLFVGMLICVMIMIWVLDHPGDVFFQISVPAK